MYSNKINNSLLNFLKKKIHKRIIDWKIYKLSNKWIGIKIRESIKVTMEIISR